MTTESIDELRSHWDSFASVFAARMERITLQLAHTLLLQLRLDEAHAFLEVGAGAGAAALAARTELPDKARHVVSDLSPNMVKLARAKLPDSVEVCEANAESLAFGDGVFDRYLANLSLMLTPDADACVSEAFRVLRPGGLAAWSVWGRVENSPMFSIPPLAAEAVGLELPKKQRSNFHLGDRDDLLARIARHGFEGVIAWYQPVPVPVESGEAYADFVLTTPRWLETLAKVDNDEQITNLRTEIAKRVEAVLATGEPLALEALLVVAKKP